MTTANESREKVVDDGGPAFPHTDYVNEERGPVAYTDKDKPGMSLRDYFAAKAMQAIIAGTATSHPGTPLPWQEANQNHQEWCAICAWQYSDAMLAARKAGAK